MIQAIIAHHGAANHHINLRSIDDATHYLGFTLTANETWTWDTPLAFPASKGIEAITEAAAGDIELTIYYWQPGSEGIGG